MSALPGPAEPRSSALSRVRAVAAAAGIPGLVLTGPGTVAWASRGLNRPIDRSASVDVVWVAVGAERASIITTEIEAPRLLAEHPVHERGFDLVAVPWWDPAAFVEAAVDVIGSPADVIGADGHPDFGHDLSVQLTAARLPLDAAEQQQLRSLGHDAAVAVQRALRAWRSGETDLAVAARIAAQVEAVGAQAPVLLVGGDERLRRFRHPVAAGRPLHETVMAVLVASRDGLHVALTRYAAAGQVDERLAADLTRVRRIHRKVLEASRPGETAGQVLAALAAGYAEEGFDGAWREHYQGGPIGYAQREFEIAPGQTASPWWSSPLPAGCAVAWNPSLAGGAKDEDTYLITDDGVEAVTVTDDWPLADDQWPARPAVLVVGA